MLEAVLIPRWQTLPTHVIVPAPKFCKKQPMIWTTWTSNQKENVSFKLNGSKTLGLSSVSCVPFIEVTSSSKPIRWTAFHGRELSLRVSGQEKSWNFMLNPNFFLFCCLLRAAHSFISFSKHHIPACSEVQEREDYCFCKFFACLSVWRVLSCTWFVVSSHLGKNHHRHLYTSSSLDKYTSTIVWRECTAG